MNEKCIGNSSVKFLQALGSGEKFKILFPEQLVLFELATSSVVEVHYAALDSIVMSKVMFDTLFC